MRLLQLKLNICNFNFLIMHVVPIRASSPQHIEHKYTPRASRPQLKEQKLTGHQVLNVLSINTIPEHQALNVNEYAWTQQLMQRQPTTSTTSVTPTFVNCLFNRV
ncbi:hypothetical protein MTR_0019s0060 [Medicago truncatula]|uniref:Uncharacterized protein n=1 Tax=Medicago truncatula TaxID=3880 RepID=A0A072TKK8_MEDTR|nr:hypothetical protein MTR_0019s0060 [Medicago truncatula]